MSTPKTEKSSNEKYLEERVKDLEGQRSKLEAELRPHQEREYREKQRAENEKRIAERDQTLVENLTRIEVLVKKTVKDPLLWPAAFTYALNTSSTGGFGPWAFMAPR